MALVLKYPVRSSRAVLMVMLIFMMSAGRVHAREIEKIDFPEQIELTGQKLVLNGVGLRTKRKLGINFRVYVAALYLAAKQTDAKAVLDSEGAKELRLAFLRSIDKDTLREAWQEGYMSNCESTCTATSEQLKAFNAAMVDVKDKSELIIQFAKDKVTVETRGKESKKLEIPGAAFAKNLLAVFIGSKPATEDLKKGLLGN